MGIRQAVDMEIDKYIETQGCSYMAWTLTKWLEKYLLGAYIIIIY